MTDTAVTAATADLDIQQSTALVPVEQRAAIALGTSKTEASLNELAVKHRDIVVIKDKVGRDQAHGAAMELLKARTTIEKVSKTARDDATKFSKAVIAEEKRLVGIIEAEEKRLFEIRDTWDAEQERIRQEKVLAEQRRVEEITAKINEIAGAPLSVANATASRIEAELQHWKQSAVNELFFQEFTDKALFVTGETVAKLTELLAAATAREAEAARIAEEQARLTEERAKLDAERAELDRQRQEQEQAAARVAAEAQLAAQRAIDEANAKSRREAAERAEMIKRQEDAFAAEKAAAQALIDEQSRALAEQQKAINAQVAEQQRIEAAEQAKKEAEQRRLREDEALSFASRVVAVVAEAFEIDPEEAEEYITRAAETIAANDKVTA